MSLFGTVVDCETLAIPEAGSLVEPVTAPSHWKDEQKIADYIAAGTKRQIEQAALYPYTAQIICLGWMDMKADEPRVEIINNPAREKAVLTEFWQSVTDPIEATVDRLITFNGRKFDLPLLQIRSLFLDVPHVALNMDRYRSNHVDVAQLLCYDGLLDYHSLRWYAQRWGFPCDDAFSGKEVAQLYEDGNWDAIKNHCAWDIKATKFLANKVARWRVTR